MIYMFIEEAILNQKDRKNIIVDLYLILILIIFMIQKV